MNSKFFPELSRRLKREGIAAGPVEKGRMPVLLDGNEVMSVSPGGTIFLQPDTADDQAVVNTYDVVAGISRQVREYTKAMASAPPLTANGLHGGFRLLADFNGVVLAGQEREQGWGYQFVTWARSPDRAAVAHGHYYENDYVAAKLDFACRAGLVQEAQQFTDEQLTELYRCVHETLDSEYPMTSQRRKLLTGISEQIQRGVDDLDERVSLSNQREMESGSMTSPSRWNRPGTWSFPCAPACRRSASPPWRPPGKPSSSTGRQKAIRPQGSAQRAPAARRGPTPSTGRSASPGPRPPPCWLVPYSAGPAPVPTPPTTARRAGQLNSSRDPWPRPRAGAVGKSDL